MSGKSNSQSEAYEKYKSFMYNKTPFPKKETFEDVPLSSKWTWHIIQKKEEKT